MGDQNNYSQEDDASFDRLMNFPDARSVRTDDASAEITDAGLTYSESDNQAFEQLMDDSLLAKMSRSGSDGNSFIADGYSDSDSNQFDELESAIDDLSRPSQEGLNSPNQQSPQDKACDPIEYSLTDKQAFNHLMSGGLGDIDEMANEQEVVEPETETSHIKIIDFDKEHAREKSRSRLGQGSIKVRYFD